MYFKKNSYLTSIIFWYFLSYFHLALFLYNFFPIKNKSNLAPLKPPNSIKNVSLDPNVYYQPKINKLILVVIDALRYDFVAKMPYVYSEINKPGGCLLAAKAESPTVTLPRIKAMTTGSVPQFIDIILNFASNKLVEDSLLHRVKDQGKKMVFYGDNTWLKLFPKIFTRSEGTTSFYVTDFTEVDNNVTRHLKKELYKNKDWDVLILHYLGLDHIGHIHGPFHPLIKIKLEEMDEIINKIHSSLQPQDKAVIVICGDHGMRDSGGHGGSSEAETLIPLIFFGVNCPKHEQQIAQSDLAPTLAALLGVSIPAQNIGKIIPEIVTNQTDQQLYLLYYNALNLLQNHFATNFEIIFKKHADFLVTKHKENAKNLIMEYEAKISEISEDLIKFSSKQNVPLLYLTLNALIIGVLAILLLKNHLYFLQIYCFLLFATFVCFLQSNFILPLLANIVSLIILGVFTFQIPNLLLLTIKFVSSQSLLLFLTFGTITRTIMLISSSYVDEEHQIWFYFWGTATFLGACQEFQKKRSWFKILLWISLFAGLRIFRHFNHTGVWDSIPDFADWLQLPSNAFWLEIVFIIGLIGVGFSCSKIFYKDKLTNLSSTLSTLTIFWYRTNLYYDDHTVIEAKITMLLILITILISFIKHKNIFKSLTVAWILWTGLLMRPYNIILIPICFWTSRILFYLCISKKNLVLFHIWMAYLFFHFQGFCNSLSSVDISAGYVGLTEFSLLFTSLQIICHTYTFPILTFLLLFSKTNYPEQLKMLHTIIIFRLINQTWYCLVILVQRQHLFIWSVFSPKLLIESCHTTCLSIVLVIYLVVSRFFVVNKKLPY